MRVLVVGLPGSGNRLTMNYFRRCGCAVQMSHCLDHREGKRLAEVSDLIVRVYRKDLDEWQRSAARQAPSWDRAMFQKCQMHIMALGPQEHVALEETVATQGANLEEIAKRHGLTPGKWPKRAARVDGDSHDRALLTPEEFAERSKVLANKKRDSEGK